VSYYFRRLERLGVIELRTRIPVRGAYRHVYALRDCAAVDDALWRMSAAAGATSG